MESVFESHAVVQGEGPPVVLIHGVGLDHTMWDPLVRAVGGRFRILRYDLIGHGRTPALAETLIFDHLARQLREVLVAHGFGRVAVVGFSLGALIAQAFVLAHGDCVDRLVLLNSIYARDAAQRAGIRSRLRQAEEHGVAANVELSIGRWFTDRFRRQCPEEIKRVEHVLRSNDPNGFLAAYRLFAESDTRFAGRLRAIGVPTLVITGAGDVGSTPAMSAAIAGEIPGAEVEVFPHVKHMLPVENADKLADTLTRFLGPEAFRDD